MGEAQALLSVDHTIDDILEKGAASLYDKYLAPKMKPYTAAYVKEIFQSYAAVSISSTKVVVLFYVLKLTTFLF